MGEALGWGLISASSLVIGALLAIWLHIGLRAIGLIMGFGAGVLISAVAFDLVEEASTVSSGEGGGVRIGGGGAYQKQFSRHMFLDVAPADAPPPDAPLPPELPNKSNKSLVRSVTMQSRWSVTSPIRKVSR